MRRCVECGRPYRGDLTGPALLELALDKLGDGALNDEHIRDLLGFENCSDASIPPIRAKPRATGRSVNGFKGS